MKYVLISFAVFLLLAPSAVAQEIGTLTLIDRPLHLIRGATVLQGAEGVRLRVADIVESSGFAQMEFGGGRIVALDGPTRVLLLQGDRANAELVLLSGWVKCERGSAAGNSYRYDTPLLAVGVTDGTIVMHSGTAGAEIYVESGSARTAEVSPAGGWGDPQLIKSGQFCSRTAGKQMTFSPRPSASFIDSMPRSFRDTLPPARFHNTGKPPQPKREHEVSYAEVQPWLEIARPWRIGFVSRFRSRLSDPQFRSALEANLRDYPEWDPVLHPERYQSKASQEANGSPAAARGGTQR